MTIDIGFAALKLPDGTIAGIVDVPGHERFLKNMLAGASGVDVVLLVVASDESVMPQTIEHLDILRLLDVKNGVVAMTKMDAVAKEWGGYRRGGYSRASDGNLSGKIADYPRFGENRQGYRSAAPRPAFRRQSGRSAKCRFAVSPPCGQSFHPSRVWNRRHRDAGCRNPAGGGCD